jgi:CRP/FNR family cyclic AMP-dependent transcriptional regulator
MTALSPVTDSGVTWHRPARYKVAPLLELDPDLGRALTDGRRLAAQAAVPVRVLALGRGPWDAERFGTVAAAHIGVLIVDGLVGRELLADDVASMELLGPGDILRPWDEAAESELLRAVVRWSALAPSRLALLDHQLAVRLAGYPEIYSVLLERFAIRTRRLAMLQAISQFNRVDRRILTLFWHLAERWGRVTPDGVLLPLALSHRMLGQLVGARRPTVSGALAELSRAGEVLRGDAGTWLLTGTPVATPDAQVSQFVAPRRAVLPLSTKMRAR